jgi:hypothetical protein
VERYREKFTGAKTPEQSRPLSKNRVRKERTNIEKYSFLNRTITEWNRLPAEALGTSLCKPYIFRKRVMKVITGQMK